MEENYKEIVEKARDAIVIIENGFVRYVNPYALFTLGLSKEEVLGEDFLTFISDDDKKQVKENYQKTIKEEKSFLYEVEIKKRNGEVIPVEIHSQKIEWNGKSADLTIIRNIQARKKAEKVFHQQEERFQAITNNTPDIIARFDEDCRYVYINEAGEKEFGIPAKDFFWKTDEDLGISSEKSEAFKDAINSVFKHRKGKTFYSELTLKGKRKYYFTIIVPEFFSDGTVKSALSITRDITEIRDIDQAKTEFISITSHQLRSPLSVINWCTISLLKGEVGNINNEQNEYLEKIYTSVRNLIKITDVFLNTTMLDLEMFVFNPIKSDVVEVAREVVKDYSKIIQDKKIVYREDFDEVEPFKIDPRVFKIVLRGLVSNAVDYTPKNGKIDVVIRKKKRGIVLQVKDSGCGISSQDKKKIFTRFYRAKSAQSMRAYGTGLDLYLIRSLLKKIGGGIRIKSPNPDHGKGSIFSVKFPPMGESSGKK